MTAIYAFSGDPITYGHIDIIQRASRIFEKVVVAIGNNPDKKYMFSFEERLLMAQKSLKIENVEVTSFSGLLVDFAYEQDISIIIRGIRNSKDFDYENELYHINASQNLEIETIFLPSKQDLTHISSSAAKALQLEKGLIYEYVPLYVKQKLEERISKQYVIGITGTIGSGKSYLADKLVKEGPDVHNIDLDKLAHEIQTGDSPMSKRVNSGLQLFFGTTNRKEIGEIVFNDYSKLQHLNTIMHEPILVKLRKEIYNKKGIILLNGALIAEMDMSKLCNNNIILVNVVRGVQRERLKERGLTEEQIEKRIGSQYSYAKKLEFLEKAIKADGGNLIKVDSNVDIKQLYDEIKKVMYV